MNASTVDRLSKIMEDLAGVVNAIASSSQANGAFALACAKTAAWKQVKDALRERASRDLRDRNALLPVHQLPVEVLARIFEMAFANEVPTDYKRLKRLRGVCYLWHKVIDNSPWMWTRIQGYDPIRVVEEALKKSSNCFLDVSITPELTYTPSDLTPFLDRLDPHLSRLKSVGIIYPQWRLPEDYYTGMKLLTTPQPSLEHFSVLNPYFQADFSELTFFADQAPRLKRLELRGMRINCRGAIFGGLSSLLLEDVTVPFLKDLLSGLNRCGHLLRLDLTRITFQTADAVDPPRERISLPFLRGLTLHKMPSTVKERLLHDIYAPQCAYLCVWFEVDAEDLQYLVTRYVPKWFSQRTPSLPEIAKIVVEPTATRTFLYFYDSKHSECFRVFLIYEGSTSISLAGLTAVNTVLKACAPKADTHLAFGQAALALAEDGNYRDQLTSLPRVTKLDIGENSRWCSISCSTGYWGSNRVKNLKLPAFPALQELCSYQQPSVWILKVVRMLLGVSEVRGEGGGFKVGIYVWADSQLAKMGSTVEEVKGIVGDERVVIGVKRNSKRYEWSL